MIKIFQYCQRFLDPTDSKASMRHAIYALVMISGVAMLAADIGVRLWKGGPGTTGDWNMGLGILVGGATGGKLLGAKNAPPDSSDVKE